MENNFKKFDLNIYNITLILSFLWILLTIIKKYYSIYFIQRNTIAMYLLIFISLSLSKYFFKTFSYTIPLIILIFLIHEYAWYRLYIGFTKDEGEVTNNFYAWTNIYCPNTLNTDLTNNKKVNQTDYSEGLFDNSWNLTNEQSFKLKFDTYFDYLNLKPGMKLLDIGCGNGQWLQYCKKKGVEGVGVTICESQYNHNKKNGLNVILGDVHKGILKTINQKFDAITNLGALEHMCSLSNTPKKNMEILTNYYDQVKNLINPNSESKRYLNSYMITNKKYSKYLDFEWFFKAYFITTTYGYGCYVFEEDIEKIYNSEKSKILIKRDCSEDYRWILIRNKDSWGYCNYNFDTPYNTFNFIKDVFTDPSWWQRFVYGYLDLWLWQFGGTNPNPMPENKDTPTRCYIYVTEINP